MQTVLYSQSTLKINSIQGIEGNSKIQVAVTGAGMPAVCAISLRIKFDPAVLKYESVTEMIDGTSFFNCVDNTIYVSWFNLTPYYLQNGLLLNINFTYLQGNCNINFDPSNCQLTDQSLVNYNMTYYNGFVSGSASDVEKKSQIISEFKLLQNYPNPFNPSTIISFDLPESAFTSVEIVNAAGQIVAEPIKQYLNNGEHKFNFIASNLPSGIYIYRIISGKYSASRKMLLLK
jgi:hypothetical protein